MCTKMSGPTPSLNLNIKPSLWSRPDALQVLVLGGMTLWLFWPVLAHLVQDWWNDSNYSHGFFIPLISAYFIWERRDQLSHAEIKPSLWGLFVLTSGLLLLVIARVGAELFLMRASLLVVLMGLVLYLAGPAYGKVFRFPIAFLVLMIPLPAIVLNALSLPLQGFAAKAATFCLQALSIPVFRDGNIIALPHLTLEVAEACSGLRSLMSLMTLGIVFAYFSQSQTWKRWVLIASTIPIAIAANALRVAGTGLLAHYFGEETAQGFYHTFSGWLVFLVAFAALAIEGALISKWTRSGIKKRGHE